MYNLFFYLYLSFSAIAAVLSISMWIDYFRKIDVFESEKIKHLLLALFIGCFTPFLSIYIYKLIDLTNFRLTGEFYNDLLYSVFAIGINEEGSKLIGVVIVLRLLKNHIKEPIDYLVYAGVTALGFTVVENFKYFNNYGIQIISTRAFYSALIHIINTSIIVYGFYRFKLFRKGNHIQNTAIAFIVSVASHGLFDFFLLNNFLGPVTPFFSTIIYLIGINFWVEMLNNANNFSDNFSYEKIHFSSNIFYRLLFWYISTLIFTFIYNIIVFSFDRAINYLIHSLSNDGLLLLVVIMRASRFRIFSKKYFEIFIQLPFYITKNQDEDFRFLYLLPIKIRGESPYEYKLTTYINKEVELNALKEVENKHNIPLKVNIIDKILLKDGIILYKAISNNKPYYLKPKTQGETETEDDFPVSGLYELIDNENLLNPEEIRLKDFRFLEWIYIK